MTAPTETADERSAGGYLRYPKADADVQARHIKAIAAAAKRRAKLQEQINAADITLHELIREGFRLGIGGQTLANTAGLSKPRAYQIRDGR